MRQFMETLVCLLVVGFGACCECFGRGIEIEAPAKTISKYDKLDLSVRVDTQYDNPFDPEEVDLTVLVKCPSGRQITLPAFFCQDYERRRLDRGRNRSSWYYPTDVGMWKARFAPIFAVLW